MAVRPMNRAVSPTTRGVAAEGSSSSSRCVVALRVERDDEAIIAGVKIDDEWARAALYDRYAPIVERIVRRLVGTDADIDVEDVMHDAFVRAFAAIGSLDDPKALEKWMRTIGARTAYRAIRSKKLRRWLQFWEPTQVQYVSAPQVDHDMLEAFQRTYAVLRTMPPKLRVPFTLRLIEGMELSEVAEICEVSLATIKRRIKAAEERFARAACRDDVLRSWVEEGSRWNS